MKRDTDLTRIMQAAKQSAPDDFTLRVMKQVQLEAAKQAYQPLVTKTLKKIFILSFLTITIAIFFICWLMQNPGVSFINMKASNMPVDFLKVLFLIAAFWLLFTVNAFLTRQSVKSPE